MRPASPDATSPLEMACFPLVPFSNRIADAHFTLGDREVRLARNFPPEPHAIHGDGWTAAWEVSARAEHAATLTHEHVPAADGRAEWPWRYCATQDFALSDRGLALRLSLTNQGDTPMPAGLGLHPYFPKLPGARLTARLGAIWINGPDMLPVERRPADASVGWDLAEHDLDNCFEGWDGAARLTLHGPEAGHAAPAIPRTDLVIDADPVFGHMVVFVPPGEDYFCVEPVSHLNDAINRAARGETGTGFRLLPPGETFRGSLRFGAIRSEN